MQIAPGSMLLKQKGWGWGLGGRGTFKLNNTLFGQFKNVSLFFNGKPEIVSEMKGSSIKAAFYKHYCTYFVLDLSTSQ